jgi:hypothetical protein
MMPNVDRWVSRLGGRSNDIEYASIALIEGGAAASMNGPFRVTASDGKSYFVKALDAVPRQFHQTIAIEYIVAGAGRLIGAPVCETRIIAIPESLAGFEVRPGAFLSKGLAHASLALNHADEAGRPYLASRSQDDNRRRHAGVYALFDWCFGTDNQWLYDLDDDRRLYSHDHGLYLPPNNGTIDALSLQTRVNEPHALPDPANDVDPYELERLAGALDALDEEAVARLLRGVPTSWPVSDHSLGVLGWFLCERAPAVAARLQNLINGASK